MTVIITAFERSPDGGAGLARDTRVRWALEEVGQRYEVRLVSLRAKEEPAHLRLHPFGLIPTYEEGDLALFETGAIVLHIAEHHAGRFPDDARSLAPACCPLRRCRLARWGVQRGRPHDGFGVAQAEALGPPGRVSDTGGLCGPRRSAAGVQRAFAAQWAINAAPQAG